MMRVERWVWSVVLICLLCMQIRVNWRYTLTEEGLPLGIGVRFIVEPEHGTPWFFFNSSDNTHIPSSLHVQVPHFPSSLIVSCFGVFVVLSWEFNLFSIEDFLCGE